MSEISYRTDAQVLIRDGMSKNVLALHWTKCGDAVKLCAGAKDVSMSANQLEELVKLAPAICKDLREGKAPKLPVGGLSGVI